MAPSRSVSEQPDFIKKQFAFTAHVRDPGNNPCPADVEDRRMNIYRELFYNNVEDFMANTYPVLRKIIPDDHWHAMIRDYFARHKSHTPLFPEMPREFLKYIENEREPNPDDPPFMLELAHYEWTELAVSVADDEIDLTGIDPQGDLLASVPVLSPLAWPLSYSYPVHQISPDFIPQQPGDASTYLIVYRDRDNEVHFLETNPVTARLIQLLAEDNTLTGQELLTQIAEELQHPQPNVVINGGREILADLLQRGVVLGIRA